MEFTPLTDPFFYLACLPAIMIVGLSKGGLGGAGAIFGVPIMSLAIAPVQAAAIMLPPLVLMNYVGLYSLKFQFDRHIFVTMLPGAIIGVGIGWLVASYLSQDAVRLVIGIIAIGFLLNQWLRKNSMTKAVKPSRLHSTIGQFWGMAAGFTSFVCHAGAPLYQVHTLPMRLTPVLYTSTAVAFFTVVDTIKLIPYFALGQFDATNLATSVLLMPYAIGCTLLGAYLVKRIDAQLFYRILNLMLFVIATYLIQRSVVDLGLL